MNDWEALGRRIVDCELCPRLRAYCADVAQRKRRAYQDCDYWGRPVPNFGDPRARLLVVGLAPAAHGANRTGRMFTGDRSGDWLYRGLHAVGFSSQPSATGRQDGLRLMDCAITAVCHCAPPANQPEPRELQNCRPWLRETFQLVQPRVFLALGQLAWQGTVEQLLDLGWYLGQSPRFAHGALVALEQGRWLLGSYHPSQQNTFTGRLTPTMFDTVLVTARQLLDS
jgi:uracil-DNA glycosylase family 4